MIKKSYTKINMFLFLCVLFFLSAIPLLFSQEIDAACVYRKCDYNSFQAACEGIDPSTDPNLCQTVTPSCYWENCPMSCTVNDYPSYNCYYSTVPEWISVCNHKTTYECWEDTIQRTCTRDVCHYEQYCYDDGGGPTPTLDVNKAYAKTVCYWYQVCIPEEYDCSYTAIRCGNVTRTVCVDTLVSVPHCLAVEGTISSISCQSDDPPVTCTVQEPCVPSCPAGQVPYDTGSPAPDAYCAYQTGNLTPGNECEYEAGVTHCWYDNVIPGIDILDSTEGSSTSSLGCTAALGTVGTESNNITKISAEFVDTDLLNPNVALQVWFSTTALAPTITKVYDNGEGKLLSNNSYGILVRKVNGTWSDIYIPGVEGSANTWVKGGTVGSGLRAEILGAASSKLAGIKNVSVTSTSGKNTLSFDIQYYNEKSGVASFEKATDGTYNIFAVANRQGSFLPSGGDTIVSVPAWKDSTENITLDLNAPVSDSITYTVATNSRINLAWDFSDSFSNIKRVVGDASIATAGSINDELDDITSGVSNYALGSGATGANTYAGYHLWGVNNVENRTDVIDLNNNEGGSLNFSSIGFDSACNDVSATLNIPLGQSWMITKGGAVNTGSGSTLLLRSLASHELISPDDYWSSPFSFYKDEADLSTELLSGSSSTLNDLLHSAALGSVRITSSSDRNNKSSYWYSELLRRVNTKIAASPASFSVINYNENTVISGRAGDLSNGGVSCDNTKNCVAKITGTLRVNSNFVCDAKIAFFVTGNITIRPDITASAQNKGCMFITAGNIVFAEGNYKSEGSTYPKYDVVEGFFLADGIIDIPLVDADDDIRDGLKINGSILGFGNTDGRSIHIARSLRLLHNNNYPALAVHYDSRYIPFAPLFFGGEIEGFEREVGFKPL